MGKKNKKVEPICRNCMLYDQKNGQCSVVILWEGRKERLSVEPDDRCFFENEFEARGEDGKPDRFKVEVNEIKLWVEDPITGERADHGVVKIEYPDSLDAVLE